MYTNVIHVPITTEMNVIIENRDGAEVFSFAETKKPFFAWSVHRITAFWKIRIHHRFVIPR